VSERTSILGLVVEDSDEQFITPAGRNTTHRKKENQRHNIPIISIYNIDKSVLSLLHYIDK